MCGYDLRGLPAEHRCPECGFAYDARTLIWQPARPWRGYGFIVGTMLLAVVIQADGLARRWFRGAGGALLSILFLLVAVAAAVSLLLHLRASNRKGRCAVVSPAGVFVRTALAERLVDWDEIVAVERVDRWIKETQHEYIVRIKTRTRSHTTEIDRIFISEEERSAFIEAVEARLRDPDRWQIVRGASQEETPRTERPKTDD